MIPLAVLVLLFSVAPFSFSQSTATTPPCVFTCEVLVPIPSSCLATDTACLCNDLTYAEAVSACYKAECTTANVAVAGTLARQACLAVGVTLPATLPAPTSTAGGSEATSVAGGGAGGSGSSGSSSAGTFPLPIPTRHKSNAVAIGAGVGGGVGALLIIALGLFFFFRFRKSRQPPSTMFQQQQPGPQQQNGNGFTPGFEKVTPALGTPYAQGNMPTTLPVFVPQQQQQQPVIFQNVQPVQPQFQPQPQPQFVAAQPWAPQQQQQQVPMFDPNAQRMQSPAISTTSTPSQPSQAPTGSFILSAGSDHSNPSNAFTPLAYGKSPAPLIVENPTVQTTPSPPPLGTLPSSTTSASPAPTTASPAPTSPSDQLQIPQTTLQRLSPEQLGVIRSMVARGVDNGTVAGVAEDMIRHGHDGTAVGESQRRDGEEAPPLYNV